MNVRSKAARDRRRMWWLDFEDPGPLFDYVDELEAAREADARRIAELERELAEAKFVEEQLHADLDETEPLADRGNERDLAVAEAVREACAKEAEEHATYKCENSEAGSELARILNKAVGEAVKTIRALDLRRVVEGVK